MDDRSIFYQKDNEINFCIMTINQLKAIEIAYADYEQLLKSSRANDYESIMSRLLIDLHEQEQYYIISFCPWTGRPLYIRDHAGDEDGVEYTISKTDFSIIKREP